MKEFKCFIGIHKKSKIVTSESDQALSYFIECSQCKKLLVSGIEFKDLTLAPSELVEIKLKWEEK